MLAFFVSLKNRVVYNYAITDKRIIVYKGIEVETTYDNIKKIKLKKFRFKKGYGTIKIYVKKGLSLNYHIVNVPEVKNVYSIILKKFSIL